MEQLFLPFALTLLVIQGNVQQSLLEKYPILLISKNEESNGINIGMNGQPGEVCVENPVEYMVDITDVFGAPGSETCVAFSVENFTQMTQNTFSINWNFEDLEFISLNPTGNLASFDATDFDASGATNGNLIIDWVADNTVQGETVPGGAVIFEVCFLVLGDPGECVPIIISDDPEPIVVTSAPTGAANVGLSFDPGSICITDVLSVNTINIIDVDCPGDDSGSIDFVIEGGSGDYNFNWEGPSINISNMESPVPLENVTNGDYNVTITDTGGISFDTTFTIGVSANAPIADAGEDFTPACDQNEIFLDGSGSIGNGLTYLWTGINSNCTAGIAPGQEDEVMPQVLGSCTYILEVTESTSGCVVYDTVTVSPQVTPQPLAGADLEVDCVQDTAFITPEIPAGDDFSIAWTAISGTIYSSPDSANIMTGAGTFVITLTQAGSGCSGTDTIMVVDNSMAPTADAGQDEVLGCADVSVSLSALGSISATGEALEYLWTTPATGNGDVCSDNTLESIDACGAGEYTLLITDTGNGCTATDMVMVMGDTLKPISNGGPDVVLNCINEGTGILDGINSSMGDSIEYSWIFNGMEIDTEAVIDVMDIGTYTLVVMNINNGCTATSVVVVTEDIAEPEVTLDAVFGAVDCMNDTDTITASTNVANASFEWSVIADDSIAIVMDGGTYSITVTNDDNGCMTEDAIMIIDNVNEPNITAGPDQSFDCSDGEAVLEGAINPAIPNAIIQWSGPAGCFDTPQNILQPTVHCEGEYILTVQDPASGCITTDTVMVTVDMTMPEIAIITSDTITCLEACATLAFTLTDPDMLADVTIEWIANGSPLPGENGTTLEICEDGLYEIVVTHNTSGCTDTAIATALDDTEAPQTADAGPDGVVDCDNPMFTLDASTSLIAGETSVQWFNNDTPPSSVGNVDEAVIMVGEGIYTLIVTDIGNGCTATDEVEITANGEIPSADAGPDVEKGCNDLTVLLDGSNSDAGDYEWTDESGMVLGTNNTIDVELEGTYTLTVTDPTTGCSASDDVIVTFNIDLDDAVAMADADECDSEGMLIGNLPTDATGVWTALNTGNITDPTATETTVANLGAGENCFVWTLSSGTCINYSADTACVMTLTANITAQEDVANILDTMMVAINVLENDQIGGGNVTFNVISSPASGTIDSASTDGIIYYTPTTGFEGEVMIDYEICSVDCPEICDTATLVINIALDIVETEVDVPNGITPNNDGMNDALVFEILVENEEEFPNNELIIFNRWGDVVFDASPYQNDWQGVNESGDNLPEGTYYYILRLDFGKAEIVRGDVTIVR